MPEVKDERVIRLDREVLDNVEVIAKKNHRTLKGEVAYALEKYVEENRHIVGTEVRS